MKYAVFFRGLNVGGKNAVKMKDLKQLLTDLGLRNGGTYIQSGNAVFESDFDEETLGNIISSGFVDQFGFVSDILIRSEVELQELIASLPFTSEEIEAAETADPKVAHLYIYFLACSPTQSELDAVYSGYHGNDHLHVGKRELFLLVHQSIRKSALAIRIAKTFDQATSRNWKTINQVYDMMVLL